MSRWALSLVMLDLLTLTLNLSMAFKQEQYGEHVQWIGATLQVENAGVTVAVKPETVDEYEAQANELRAWPRLVPEGPLRTQAGR